MRILVLVTLAVIFGCGSFQVEHKTFCDKITDEKKRQECYVNHSEAVGEAKNQMNNNKG